MENNFYVIIKMKHAGIRIKLVKNEKNLSLDFAIIIH
jgi:hypothetical protein